MARRILLVLLSLVVLVVLAAGGLLALIALRPETFRGQVDFDIRCSLSSSSN